MSLRYLFFLISTYWTVSSFNDKEAADKWLRKNKRYIIIYYNRKKKKLPVSKTELKSFLKNPLMQKSDELKSYIGTTVRFDFLIHAISEEKCSVDEINYIVTSIQMNMDRVISEVLVSLFIIFIVIFGICWFIL